MKTEHCQKPERTLSMPPWEFYESLLGVIKIATNTWLCYEIPKGEMKEHKEEMDFVWPDKEGWTREE